MRLYDYELGEGLLIERVPNDETMTYTYVLRVDPDYAGGGGGEDGEDGEDGAQGPQGKYLVRIYIAAAPASPPATPTGGEINPSNGSVTTPTGWSETPVAPGDAQELFFSETVVDPKVNPAAYTPTWSAPVESGGIGPMGTRGGIWFVGPGAPTSLAHVTGDMYLNRNNADVYRFASNFWNREGNIRGIPGTATDGTDGIDGEDGEDGEDGQDAYGGPWVDLSGTIAKGVITDHNSGWYISIDEHPKQVHNGPDTDTSHWRVLTNYEGVYDGTKYYHPGVWVKRSSTDNTPCLSLESILPNDPAPDADDNTKWFMLAFSSTGTGPTIFTESRAPTSADGSNRDIWINVEGDERVEIWRKIGTTWVRLSSATKTVANPEGHGGARLRRLAVGANAFSLPAPSPLERRWTPHYRSGTEPKIDHAIQSATHAALILNTDGSATDLPDQDNWGTQHYPPVAAVGDWPMAQGFRFDQGANRTEFDLPHGEYFLGVRLTVAFSGDWTGRTVGISAYLNHDAVGSDASNDDVAHDATIVEVASALFRLPDASTWTSLVIEPSYVGTVVAQGASVVFTPVWAQLRRTA